MTGFLGRTAGRRLTVVLAFLLVAVGVVGYLLSATSLRMPLISAHKGDYSVAVDLDDVDNLATVGQVRIAGIQVGEVREIAPPHRGQVRVVINVYPGYAPLHRGVTVSVGTRSLVGEGYLSVVDGRGEPIESGEVLPAGSGVPSTQVSDVLRSLDPDSRVALGGTLRSLGAGTEGTQGELRATVAGLGQLGRDGHTAVEAIAAQAVDLKALARETTTLLDALDTGQGQIADLVDSGSRLAGATAGQRPAIESSVEKLPGVLAGADHATVALTDLAGALGPVAEGLRRAAPDLAAGLRELPVVTREVRELVPPLSGTLDRAPDTLERVSPLRADTDVLIPSTRIALRDLNPMLTYLKPYGGDVATFVALFNGVMESTDEVGHHYAALQHNVNDSVQSPLAKNQDLLTYRNPYPKPDMRGSPGPFVGQYPRITEEN